MNGEQLDDAVARSAAQIRDALAGRQPEIAVLLGSGWGGLADCVKDPTAIGYADLPAFPHPGVEGHAGWLLLGRIGNRDVAVLSGRQHTYENGDPAAMKGALRTLALLGTRVLVQTNAAGSLDARMQQCAAGDEHAVATPVEHFGLAHTHLWDSRPRLSGAILHSRGRLCYVCG